MPPFELRTVLFSQGSIAKGMRRTNLKYVATLTKRQKEMLQEENVRMIADKRGLSVEEALFSMMKTQPFMFGATSDWEDIRPICIAVIRELLPYKSCEEIYHFVLRVVTLYDTEVITVLRVFSDVRRLAYFVNEMIESLLEIPSYCDFIVHKYGADPTDKIMLRGLVLKRITSEGVQEIFLEDTSRFFRAETFSVARALGVPCVGKLATTGA